MFKNILILNFALIYVLKYDNKIVCIVVPSIFSLFSSKY